MFAAILAFLKKAALKAATVAKAAAKGVVEHPVKTLIDQTPPGQLYNAFKSMATPQQGKPGVADVGGMGNVPTAPADYYKSPQGQITPPNQNMQSAGSAGSVGMGGAGQGILSFLGQSGVGENKGQDVSTYQPNRTPIPVNYQQFTRQPGMQYAPGPEGSVIGGQGEVTPGFAMNSPRIPPAYLNMANAGQQQPAWMQPKPDVGFMRGMINATTGQPQPEGLGDVSQGRRTAYYSGELIPKILMSRLGQPSPAEASAQQQQIASGQQLQQTRKAQEVSPAYQSDLQSAVKLVTEKGLSDQEKTFMYQKLASKYPQRSSELKRIFFPQASDAWAETLGNIMAGSSAR